MNALNTYLDHTLLKADATRTDILAVTAEAKEYRTASVCVNTCYTALVAQELKGSGVKILVDGGIRTGVDVFKALALGADAVLICRPFVTAVYGGGEEGVKCYIDKIAAELADTMQMCGAHSIEEITPDMVRV